MTSEQSLKRICRLMGTFPGVNGVEFRQSTKFELVRFFFYCNDIVSLRAITDAAVWANVLLKFNPHDIVFNPDICDAQGIPFAIEATDTEVQTPTEPERFGVYLSAELLLMKLMTRDEVKQVQTGWNSAVSFDP